MSYDPFNSPLLFNKNAVDKTDLDVTFCKYEHQNLS